MPVLIEIQDSSSPLAKILVPQDAPTLRDLLRARIHHEVATHNQHLPEVFTGLVQPEESEQILNGFRLTHKRPLDAERQFTQACDAFTRNGFLVLAGDRQITDLDAPLNPGEPIQFLKLTPLIGG
jgi:hypothetical protein